MVDDFLYPLLVCTIGPIIVGLVAGLGHTFTKNGAWRRLIWVTSMTAILTMLVVELTGLGMAFRILWQGWGQGWATAQKDLSVGETPIQGATRFFQENIPPKETLGATGVPFSPTWRPAESERGFANRPGGLEDPSLLSPRFFQKGGPGERYHPGLLFAGEVIWLVGAFVWVIRLGMHQGSLFLLRCRNRGQVPLALQHTIARYAQTLGLNRSVRVILAPGLPTPVAFGVFRPTIGLPGDFEEFYLPEHQEAVLLHELAHLAHRDPVWWFVFEGLTAVLWWHPVMWWMRRQFSAACEEAADERSALIPNGFEYLAAALVETGRRMLLAAPPAWAAKGTGEGRSLLAHRVRRLLALSASETKRKWRKIQRVRRPLLVMTIGLVVCVVTGVGPLSVSDPFVVGGSLMRSLSCGWHRSLLVTVVGALFWTSGFQALAEEEERPADPPREEVRKEVPDRPREGEPREVRPDRPREGEPREVRPDRPRDREGPLSEEARRAMLERLERRQEELRKAIAQARESGRKDAMERLERQLHEVELALQNVREGRPPVRLPEAQRERPPIPERVRVQMEKLRHALSEARKANRPEEVARLERELAELERRGREGFRPPVERPPIERLEHRLAELREALAHAREAGREKQVEQLQEEIAKVEKAMRIDRERRPPPPREERSPIPSERVERVRRAAELLRREGFEDMAELLLRTLERESPSRPER